MNEGSELMIKKIAWETFKNTGDINTFMELKQIENIEKGIEGRSSKSLKEGLRDTPFIRNNKFNGNENNNE